MKASNLFSIRNVLFGLTVAGGLIVAPAGWCSTTNSDNFNDGNDTAPTIAWEHYDPIGEALTIMSGTPMTNAEWNFPGGNTYQIVALPSPEPGGLGQARAGSIAPGGFGNFYVAADVVNWDNTVHQVFGLLARVGTPTVQQTTGYMLDWDSSSNLASGGDMDIVRLEAEVPTDLDGSTIFGNDGIHLTNGVSYRFVFMGVSNILRGQVYDLANLAYPLVDYVVSDPAYDPNGSTHVSGPTGLLAANNAGESGYTGGASATFDNFVATDGDLLAQNWPLLKVSRPSAGTVCLSWPFGTAAYPLNLYSSPSVVGSPVVWTGPLTPTGTNGAWQVYCVSPATGREFFKLAP
jgi:hypothetical protein